jgi:ankyrin repeat protein
MKKRLLLAFTLLAGCLAAGRASGAMKPDDFAELCRTGTSQAIKAAVAGGADVNAQFTDDGLILSPLLSAARKENPDRDLIAFLVKNGADIDAQVEYDPDDESSDGPEDRSEGGNTALMYAAWADDPDPELISFLLQNGADPNKGRTTPLMVLLSNRYYFNPYAGRYPMDVNLELVALLLKNGANVNAKDNSGRTPLVYAADNSTEAVLLLLKNGADVNAGDDYGMTPLMSVVEGKYAADEDASDDEPPSALEMRKMVRLLLENGAEVNARDNEGRTALMLAAAGRHDPYASGDAGIADPETVALLLENGADARLRDNDGQTALDYAAPNLEGTDVRKRLAEAGSGAAAGAKTSTGDAIVLLAENADLRSAPDVIVEGNPRNLGGWKVGNTVRFLFDVEKAGEYEVALTYSKQRSDGDRADLKIAAGEASITGPLPVTGDNWSNYVEYDFGRLFLPEGQTFLEIESTRSGGGYVMNLRAVRLVPAK